MSGEDLSIPLAKSLVEVARKRMWDAIDETARALSVDDESWSLRHRAAEHELALARVALISAQDRFVLILEQAVAEARSRRSAA